MSSTLVSVLPKDLVELVNASTQSAPIRYIRLPHPRTKVPCLFLPHETRTESTILELQSISPDASRSWFINNSHVVSDGRLLLHTPIDSAFLLAPLLSLASLPGGSKAQQFRTAEDMFEHVASRVSVGVDEIQEDSPEQPAYDILSLHKLRCVHDGMRRICEFKEVTEEITVYRFSEDKLLQYARAKVDHLASPAVFDGFRALRSTLARSCLLGLDESKADIVQLGRTKAALDLVSHYLAPETTEVLAMLYDFASLDVFIKNQGTDGDLGAMIKIGRTKSSIEDEFDASVDKEKNGKRKAKEQGGRNVAKLAKSSKKGMKELTSFFPKK
ncbi:ribonuclease H2, subunit B [Auriculariales sp. MPI-PUGE-AT-0066]|nr:ribonuclease H2, subunit B [Auriculariales sp. MPI-PUGE-AT-0066]